MMLRKLKQSEHIKTRKLWEEIFKEDTKEFLDYYYSVKVMENEIYVIEEDGEIVSMLHLNPYQMRIKEELYQTHYIVAVATDKAYRRRGYMASLLNYVLKVMTDRGEPFTFLMPAAEAIYKPFGFEFIYTQKKGKLMGHAYESYPQTEFCFATSADCNEIAEFANNKLQKYDVVTWRDAAYYEKLLEELKSEQGGILLARGEGYLAGVFCVAKRWDKDEINIEIREPLFEKYEVFENAIYHLTESETTKVFCRGYGTLSEPMIMAKVLNPQFKEVLKTSKVFLNEVV